MSVIAVIPARMGSSRFPGKPMKKIHGMPMVEHCYHRSRLSPGIDEVYVATCDNEIYNHIISIGGNAVLTSKSHTRATTRTSEALIKIEEASKTLIDIVVMVQGDEPLIKPDTIGETIKHFEDEKVNIVNIMSRIDTMKAFKDKNNVKVVIDKNNDALYFSREAIPSPAYGLENSNRYMQTGIIAFKRDTLLDFNAMHETFLEKIESVDMNRLIENGIKVRMVLTNSITIGVDVSDELKEVERHLIDDNIMSLYLGK
jgi:3-deoxy-manno-octulosonate cytidylyltransferase (CMP-KDO synthetase)